MNITMNHAQKIAATIVWGEAESCNNIRPLITSRHSFRGISLKS